MKKSILLIEDEPDIADVVMLHLNDHGYEVIHADDGVRGLALALQKSWDLILLDLTLPRLDGLSICQQVSETNPEVPIVLVTARGTELERIEGLELGADDYITKPFSIHELLARIKAVFRRVDAISDKSDSASITINDIVLNPVRHTVSIAGEPVILTVREFDLLMYFAKSPGQVFKRAELLEKVWGYGHEGYLHTVNTHINRLRAKIEPNPSKPYYIQTVWGVGYKLTV